MKGKMNKYDKNCGCLDVNDAEEERKAVEENASITLLVLAMTKISFFLTT
jgi:hypothetical protein